MTTCVHPRFLLCYARDAQSKKSRVATVSVNPISDTICIYFVPTRAAPTGVHPGYTALEHQMVPPGTEINARRATNTSPSTATSALGWGIAVPADSDTFFFRRKNADFIAREARYLENFGGTVVLEMGFTDTVATRDFLL